MVTQASFEQAAADGAKLVGITSGVPAGKPPQTSADMAGNPPLKKTADSENPVNCWVCLQSAVAGLPLSYPARVAPTAENAGVSEQDQISTPESTPQAVLLAECIRQHLPPAALEQLLAAVAGSNPTAIR